MSSDLLDEYCMQEFGHINWEMSWDDEGNMLVKFFNKESEHDSE